MFRAKMFSYNDSGIYYQKYGIDPDRHFDMLRKRWGTDVAVEMVDGNMKKAWEGRWKGDAGAENGFRRVPEGECPFG